jgi:hypothetical protein
MSAPEICTIFSDASHSGNKAGWAMWAKFRGQTIRSSDGIKFPVESIHDAETIALASAIMRSIKDFDLPLDAIVVIQSDSTQALAALLWAANRHESTNVRIAKNTDAVPKASKKLTGERASFADRAFRAIDEHNLTVYLKHVRAHTKKDDARSWVNEWCDGMAKKEMRAVVHQSPL